MSGSWVQEWWLGADTAAPVPVAPQRHRRRRRALVSAAVGISYATDLAILALFVRGGAAPAVLLAIYAAGALAHVAVFGGVQWFGLSERASNPNLTALQMAWAIALQLGAMLWAPAVAGYFLGVIFVVFSFGALRLPLRAALTMWMGTAAALALLLWLIPVLGAMAPGLRGSPWVRVGAALGFATLLLRCIVLNFRAMALHTQSLQRAAHLAAEAQAAHERATRDGLTGALNRDGLRPLVEHELERVQRREAPCCVAMIDIDWFKSINDDLGHLAGDRTLRMLVDLMHRHLRAEDRLARFGGEEFVLLMPDTAEREAIDAAERLRRVVAGHAWSEIAEGMVLTVSIGVAQASARDRIEDLLARADTALYGAKASGRNRCCAAVALCD